MNTKKCIADEPKYRITPLGIMVLHMPEESAKRLIKAMEDRATRYDGDGVPGMIFDGAGGRFVKIHNDPKKADA